MNNNEFWSTIKYSDEDYIKGEEFIKLRGLDAHINVRDYLYSFGLNEVTYSQIATTFRYEKRIRRIIFKYIGLLEEYIRAYIANKYRNDISKINLTKIIQDLYNDNGNKLGNALDELTLGELFNEVKKLDEADLKALFKPNVYTTKSCKALRVLRNQVSHNKFLLNNLNLEEVELNKSSLRYNLINLYNYLPDKIKDTYKKEINAAKIDKDSIKNYQTNWDLIEDIVIVI